MPRAHWTSGGAGFDPAHLWFLYVLLVFSLALLPLFWYLLTPHGTRLAGRSPDRPPGIRWPCWRWRRCR
jgi:hypothetical protein